VVVRQSAAPLFVSAVESLGLVLVEVCSRECEGDAMLEVAAALTLAKRLKLPLYFCLLGAS
jgi:hypothetical protein